MPTRSELSITRPVQGKTRENHFTRSDWPGDALPVGHYPSPDVVLGTDVSGDSPLYISLGAMGGARED